MRLLVFGGRNWTDAKATYDLLDKVHKEYGVDVVIEGDARGADRMAGYWARKNRIDLKIFPAQWDLYGKSAGYKRNQQMLDEGRPNLAVKFPGGKGTEMMHELCKKAGVTVIEYK